MPGMLVIVLVAAAVWGEEDLLLPFEFEIDLLRFCKRSTYLCVDPDPPSKQLCGTLDSIRDV